MPECRDNRTRRQRRAARHDSQLDAECKWLRRRLMEANRDVLHLRSSANFLKDEHDQELAAERKRVEDFLWPLVSLRCGPLDNQKLGVYLTVEVNPVRLEFTARNFHSREEMAKWVAEMLTFRLAKVLADGLVPACAREQTTLKARVPDGAYTGGRP